MTSARAAIVSGTSGSRGKMLRLAIDVQADDGLRPELLLLGDEQHGLQLVVGRLFGPPRTPGGRHSLLERHAFPQARRSQRRLGH